MCDLAFGYRIALLCEAFIVWDVYIPYMTLITKKVKRKNGKTYYSLVDERRVGDRVIQKYVGYIGKDPKSKSEITFGEVLPYVTRLMDLEISDAGIHSVLRRIGIDADISPITKIVLENDRKLKRTFLRIR